MTDMEFLSCSSADSLRFGFKVIRGTVPPQAPAGAVIHDIRRLRPSVAIFRCEAGDSTQMQSLRSEGLFPIHADTLVHYRGDLDQAHFADVSSGSVAIVRASARDRDAIAAIAARSFSGYKSHYHANPLFDHEKILQGYVEWATSHAEATTNEVEAWVAEFDGKVRGFATCRLDSESSKVEVLLNAVDPDWSGKGVYTRLLASIMRQYQAAGMQAVAISTQVWNYRVQRVWARLGLVLERAEDTYHVNLHGQAEGGVE
ncbi:GNAT family N-acetyltransferase [Pseudoxanthomonas sacheonensis]|uniref:GNAT family N-acetyltransferase n=1 Tax=Pseudoxanthomonas sacheonensis TaxID=443615 RepID=UPI0013D01B65|nr:GNAT family N-acetyltransferase [Pseudoxanthomonas sacheonensis]